MILELKGYEHITTIAIRVDPLDDLCDAKIKFAKQNSHLESVERNQLEARIKYLHEIDLEPTKKMIGKYGTHLFSWG